MTAIDIIQRFAKAAGVRPVPTSAVGNPAEEVVQMLELLNQEGRELSRRTNWQVISFETTFTTVAVESQGTIASAIAGAGTGLVMRKIRNDLMWNRTSKMPIVGPETATNWAALKAMGLTAGPYSKYRIMNNRILFSPVPTAGETVAFEFVSKNWATDTAGTTYLRNIESDDDEVLLDDEIMIAGLEWRWLRKKRLGYAEEFASYEGMVVAAIGDDGTKKTMSLDSGDGRYKAGVVIPIGDWMQ